MAPATVSAAATAARKAALPVVVTIVAMAVAPALKAIPKADATVVVAGAVVVADAAAGQRDRVHRKAKATGKATVSVLTQKARHTAQR